MDDAELEQAFLATLRRFGKGWCQWCRRPLKSGEVAWLGSRGQLLLVVATCCAQQLETRISLTRFYPRVTDIGAEWLDKIPPRGSA
jgi:hypothetical protein